MSTEDTTQNFEASIEEIYQQYRHRQLANQLDEIAETIEETVLQQILAEEFLETELEIDPEAKQAVSEAQELLESGDFETLGERIADVEAKVEDQKRRISNEIHEVRISIRSSVKGMMRLNERVERVSEVKLQAIHELLSDWDWKGQVYREKEYDFETLKERAAEYGEDMRRYFEECREQIFGPYEGTPMEPIVDKLLSDDRLSLDELSDEQISQLRESDLVDHVELALS